MAERITPRKDDFAKWYSDIIEHAKLADHSPVRGCMVLRPNGYALWEQVQKQLDQKFKETGHQNAYFPLFIPQSFIAKEKEHVEGFAPQLAVVTHGGGKKLDEPLIVRPTSETIINHMYSKWIQSYRDLPVLINQWANVVRWELRTKPFLRSMEFLWQEGHTCHETEDDAKKETFKMLDVYNWFFREIFAIPSIAGQKTQSEKFAGAEASYSLELMMQDKQALQGCTSHFFGTRFAQAFDIKFQDRTGKMQFVHQTTWGLSTRVIGALIMTHSDDQGLVLPPKAAPIQVVIVPILMKNKDATPVLEAAKKIQTELRAQGVTCHLDAREEHSAGYKFNEWEINGIPLRVELGPRDLADGICIVAKRVGGKTKVKLDDATREIPKMLEDFQKELYVRAADFLKANTHVEDAYDKFSSRLDTEEGFYLSHWCGSAECEAKVKEETKATIRNIPFDQKKENGKCIKCGAASTGRVVFARSY